MKLLRIHLLALLAYTGLALLLTWPLALRLASHVPGDGVDDPALAWNLWWLKERLVDQRNLDIFHVGWMFYPIDINLAFYTLTPLNGLLSIPLQTAASRIVATNLLLLSTFVLSGYGTFLLAKDLLAHEWRSQPGVGEGSTGHWLLPFLSGVIYAFASAKLFYAALGQFNIASSQWIPFAVLYAVRTGRGPGWRNPLLAGLFLTFQAWAELTFASFLVLFIGLYGLWQMARAAGRQRAARPAIRLLNRYGLTGLVFLLGLAPFLWAMLPDLRAEGDFFSRGGGFADVFSADLIGYLLPTRLHPLLGDWVAGLPFSNDVGQHIFLGYSGLALALLGAGWLLKTGGPARLIWPLLGLLFWLLTLGPAVRIFGQPTPVPGPFALISRLPFFSGNRYPSRYSVLLLLIVALLAALGGAALARRLRWPLARSALPLLLAGLFLLEHLAVPLPLSDMRTPWIYRLLAEKPGDFAVLELPTGWRNGAQVMGRSDLLIMQQQWYQTTHGKRRLGGNTSRNPDYKFDYFRRAPLIGDLIALMNADAQDPRGQAYLSPQIAAQWQELLARNRASAPAVLDFLDVGFVVLHVQRAPPELTRFVEEVLPVAVEEEWQGQYGDGQPGIIRLYRVLPRPAPDEWTIELASPDATLHLAEGWSRQAVAGRIRYATRPDPALLLDIPTGGGRLTLDVYGPARLQRVALDGQPLVWTAAPWQGNRQQVEILIPPGLAAAPVDRLGLGFGPRLYSGLYAEATNRDLPQPIGETGSSLPPGHGLLVESAGAEAGGAARIFVTNREGVAVDVAPGGRGYNLAALDGDGQLLEARGFDTHGDAQASARMAEWLAQWPRGTVVAGAVADEASFALGGEAVAALARLGVQGDLRDRFRWGHGFVGVVGAGPGTAVEALSVLDGVSVGVGLPLDAPQISGGVGRVRFSSGDVSTEGLLQEKGNEPDRRAGAGGPRGLRLLGAEYCAQSGADAGSGAGGSCGAGPGPATADRPALSGHGHNR